MEGEITIYDLLEDSGFMEDAARCESLAELAEKFQAAGVGVTEQELTDLFAWASQTEELEEDALDLVAGGAARMVSNSINPNVLRMLGPGGQCRPNLVLNLKNLFPK